jgi:alpha,alpha-trehalase
MFSQIAKSSVEYLRKSGAIRCKGGVPTSMNESGQQWDFPNAWPPLQQILVAGKMLIFLISIDAFMMF